MDKDEHCIASRSFREYSKGILKYYIKDPNFRLLSGWGEQQALNHFKRTYDRWYPERFKTQVDWRLSMVPVGITRLKAKCVGNGEQDSGVATSSAGRCSGQ